MDKPLNPDLPKPLSPGAGTPEFYSPPPRKNPLEKLKQLLLRTAAGTKNLTEIILKKKRPSSEKTGQAQGGFEIQPPDHGEASAEWLQPWIDKLPPPLRPLAARYGVPILVGFVILFLIFTMKSCFGKKAPKVSLSDRVAGGAQSQEGPVPVKGFKIGRFNFEDSLNALGTIKGSVEFKLSFEIPGMISSINYREGERYEEGALLISLRQDDILLRLKKSQADLNKYQTQAQIAQKKVDEHEKLFAMGAIPKTTLENIKLELESSQYEAEAARLEVKAAETMLEKSNLYAPSGGMIGELNIEEGEAVTPNTLLGSHISTEYVFAEFGVVERDVNKIALGQKARVFVDAFPDKTFEGVIENISPVVAGTSRTATAKVRIENPDRLLLPGMFARIRILLYSKKNTLVVPTDAIQGGQGEQFVYVIHLTEEAPEPVVPVVAPEEAAKSGLLQMFKLKSKEKKAKAGKETPGAATEKAADKNTGTIEKRPITVGYTRPDYSQIDAGISEGELVAISGLERLEDGKHIRLLETQEAEV